MGKGDWLQIERDAWKVLKGKPLISTEVKENKTVIERVEIPYDVTRHQLGSISPKDIRYYKSMTQEERESHESEISTIAEKEAFKMELESMIDTQVYWMAQEADGDRQHIFGKGTQNGISLVLERFATILTTVRKRNEPEEPLSEEEKYDHPAIPKE